MNHRERPDFSDVLDALDVVSGVYDASLAAYYAREPVCQLSKWKTEPRGLFVPKRSAK